MIIRTSLFLLFIFWLHIFSFAQFTLTTTTVNVTCPAGSNGIAAVSVSGGTSPYTYAWSTFPVQTSSFATGLTAGNYSVTISDNAGEDSTLSISISQPDTISDNPSLQSPVCIRNGYIALSPSGGTSPYQFLWNTGQTIAGMAQLGTGNYSVIVTDANSCTSDFSYSLAETECFISPASWFTPNEDGYNDTWSIANSGYFPNARLIVFDRWGTKVYEHKGLYEQWDGKSYLGIPVPDAVYYYFFYRDADEKQKDSKYGSVTILR